MAQNGKGWQGVPALFLLLWLLLLTACLGGGNKGVLGDDAALANGTAKLVCSQECANQGHCGDTADGAKVVLLNSLNPTTRAHDLLLPVDSEVQINGGRSEMAIRIATGESLAINFYQVTASDRTGWVAGWCIQGQPAQ